MSNISHTQLLLDCVKMSFALGRHCLRASPTVVRDDAKVR